MSSEQNKSRMLIVPYGMHCNNGLFIEPAYSHLSKEPNRVLFFVPTNTYCYSELMGMAPYEFAQIEDYSNFDRDFYMDLRMRYEILRFPFEFEREEILYPHIKYLRENMPERKLLPIFYNNLTKGVIKSFLENFWEECCFVFFSYMSFGYSYDEAKEIDETNAKELENNRADDFCYRDFSAYRILPDIVEFNKERNYQFKRIATQNSADYTDPNREETMGFGAWYLAESR